VDVGGMSGTRQIQSGLSNFLYLLLMLTLCATPCKRLLSCLFILLVSRLRILYSSKICFCPVDLVSKTAY
jgi:hypothetical protein